MLALFLSLCSSEELGSLITFAYEEYRYLMLRGINNIVNDKNASAEILHRTFLKIIVDFDKIDFDAIENKKAYFYISARNMAKDYMRKKKIELVEFDERYFVRDIDFTSSEELDYIINNENYERLISCIYSLPEPYSRALRMKYLSGIEEKRVTEILNISYNNAAQRIHRAKKYLEKKMEAFKNEE